MEKREKPVRVKNYAKKKDSTYMLNKNGTDNVYRIYTHKNPSNIIVGLWEANKGKKHPTQKPVSLLKYLIKTYTKENETVLDFTMGSGSTGVACIKTNRNFIGIEKEKEYYEIAKQRIKEAKNNV